jgi:hypothetical protein
MEEELAFSDWINTNLGGDPGLGHILPIQVQLHFRYTYRYTFRNGTGTSVLQVHIQVHLQKGCRYR